MIVGRSRVVGLFALATFVATIGLPFVAPAHAFGDDIDVGWGEQPLSFGGAVTKVASPRAPRTNEHCALCHWGRVLGGSVTADPVRSLPPDVEGALIAFRSQVSPTSVFVARAPRGPPVSL